MLEMKMAEPIEMKFGMSSQMVHGTMY